jgi:hypothetical protein
MTTTQQGRLKLTEFGTIPIDYPREFFRVEHCESGRMIADFSTKAQAESFAISFNGWRHKVSKMIMRGN